VHAVTTATAASQLHVPASLADALAVLAREGDAAAPLAGGTWVMRAPVRGERLRRTYVSLTALPELAAVHVDGRLTIGGCVTHAQLAAAAAGHADLRAVVQAAARSANPAVRQMATVGGNLMTAAFPAADLVPALLALGADVVLARSSGEEQLPLGRLLEIREQLDHGAVLARVVVPRAPVVSAHARLPLRAAGDYPVAIVSVALQVAGDGVVEHARVAVGSVEPLARRWPELEEQLTGRPVDPEVAAAAAERVLGSLRGRDGVEAPGWYRERVVPTLVRRALIDLMKEQTWPSS
jgi:aerobic carbon-monoxide dehydrogenase medium subunit